MESPFRASVRRRTAWKVWVVLLSVGLISVVMLAKHSFGLPRTSGSHWISQTCKIQESRRAAPVRTSVIRATLPIFRADLTRANLPPARRNDAPVRPLQFFSSAALRSPPSFS